MARRKHKPLPPGTYAGTIEKIRKVRNKPAYAITFNIAGQSLKAQLRAPNPRR